MPSRDIIDDVYSAQGIRIAPQRTSRYITAEVFLKRLFAGKSGFVARKRRQKALTFSGSRFTPSTLETSDSQTPSM